jgi:DNA polymerase elongation subunit (family B)
MEGFLHSWQPPLPRAEVDGRLKLWLWEVHVTHKLPEEVDVRAPPTRTSHTTDGVFVILFCKTLEGASVTLIVEDWRPWMRVLSRGSKDVASLLSPHLAGLRRGPVQRMVSEDPKRKLYGWEPDEHLASRTFSSVRLVMKTLYGMDRVQTTLEHALDGEGRPLLPQLLLADTLQKPKTRFLHDTGLCPCAWFFVEGLSEDALLPSAAQVTTAALEMRVLAAQLVPDLADERIPPLRLASFDCEMSSHDGSFPSPFKGDTTFCISTTLGLFPSSDDLCTVSIVRGRPALESTPTHLVLHADSTLDLMEQWRDLIRAFDPDIITGWNTEGFDFEFVFKEHGQLFRSANERGTEPMMLCALQADGQPATSLAESLKRVSASRKAEIFSSMPSEKQGLLRTLFRTGDGSSHLNAYEEGDDDEVHVSKNILPPDVFVDLRKQLGLNTRWTPSKTVQEALSSRFGDDACAMMLAPSPPSSRLPFLSRMASEPCSLVTRTMNTAAKGDNVMQKVNMTGRVVLDMMRVIKDDQKPPSIALKWAADNWLGSDFAKLDMPTSELFRAWKEKDAKALAEVVTYCARDSEIPLRILLKLQYLTSWIGLSRVCFLNPDSIVNGGQQQRVFSLITRRVRDTHAVNVEPSGWPATPDYVGATVIEPDAGFFDKPISTLDFASLYPSIMGSNNLCFSTLVTDRSLLPKLVTKAGQRLFQDFAIEHPVGDDKITRYYAFVTHVRSVLADALIALLAERKAVKKQMEGTEDPFLREVLNKRQLALKVVCNSVYGFTGVDVDKGLLSCKPVAAVTTLIGRRLIGLTKTWVEAHFAGSRVVYGDTDSVMILWGVDKLEEAFALGEEAAVQVTRYLRDTLVSEQGSSDAASSDSRDISKMVSIIKLEHEKEYWPYLLLKKKNYAGRKWTPKSFNPLVLKDEVDMKGIQAVRRDTVPFIAELSKALLDALLIDKSADKALSLVRSVLHEVSLEKLPLEKYIMSKSIASSYANEATIPHVAAWNRMKMRGDDDPPPIGGRMPFVFVNGSSAVLATRAEHPEHVRGKKLKLDTAYYINAAVNPVKKLLQFFDDGTLDEVFTDALNTARSRHTHSLMEFLGSEEGTPSPSAARSSPKPAAKRRRTGGGVACLLDDFA